MDKQRAMRHLRSFRDAAEAMDDAITDEEREAQAAEALHHALRLDRVADLGRLLSMVRE